MQSFSIRNIELLTGIKAHTLRIWEQRYNFFKAQRKESKQRIYSNEDLKKLLCISFLYHNGWKVSKIAVLSDDGIVEEVRKVALHISNYKTYVQQLLQAALDFNEASFLAVLNELIENIGFEKTIIDVCYPYLHRIGLLWDTGNVIPAQEHFSSYLIQNRLISETERFSAAQNEAPELALFCPENEYHELPLLFLNYLLRKNNWKVLYLGANIKLADLKEAAQLPGIRFLYLHLITNFTGVHIDDYLETLRRSFPDHQIFVSGRGIEQSQRSFVGLQLLRRDEDIFRLIESREKQAFPR
ncbi:MerR family transcriptional regulator [Flavisolibacter ginsenosidimutans]|uniref:MerR family transcriptional regulator n=1 Tax=Flavisolibacter ginsenosidimutans TaxID=661481 RepID=A0A5B8UG63_9BACT|nr:B12-binding domain-containing protein [Flavisolibacter ginsenosidimutans]QEC55129.1 MerR family transcriptional regulator [Flavisolibacter ginsenosidimutans]